MNCSPFIVVFPECQQADKVSQEYLRDEHYLFENMIMIDSKGLDSFALAADLETYSYQVIDNCCPIQIQISPLKSYLVRFLSLLTIFVPLPNQISNYLYLRFCCQYVSTDLKGTQIWLAPYSSCWKYIYCSDDGYLVSYHVTQQDNCFYDEHFSLNDDLLN